jgi:DNA-directed RNA polymerase specialized sigma24 family protein
MDEVTADSEGTLEAEIAAVPFEGLIAVVSRGGSLDDWNAVFSQVIEAVAARVRARFPYSHAADSAAHSALATVLRRMKEEDHDSRLDRIDGPDALIGYVVLIAHDKAWEKIRRHRKHVPLPRDDVFLDPRPAQVEPGSEDDEQVAKEAIRVEMAHQLGVILTRMNLLLKNEQQRSVFALLYRKMYGIEKLTDAEIAARTNLTDRTVRRVRRKVEAHWPQLVADGRRAMEALEAQFRRYAGD